MRYAWLAPCGAAPVYLKCAYPLAFMVTPDSGAVRAEVERIAVSVLFRNSERRVQVLGVSDRVLTFSTCNPAGGTMAMNAPALIYCAAQAKPKAALTTIWTSPALTTPSPFRSSVAAVRLRASVMIR